MKEALRLATKEKALKLFVKKQEVTPVKVESKIESLTEPLAIQVPDSSQSQFIDPKADTQTETQLTGESKISECVHEGIACDGCEQQPIRGLRFICTSCKDYNLCSSCESKNGHPLDHVLLKVKVPLPSGSDFPSAFPKWVLPTPQREHPSMRPRAHFVRDVTIADGSAWRPGQRVIKTWSLKNVGKICWPRGTKLVFVNGTIKPIENEEQPLIPLAAPGEVIDVSVKVQMPDKPGRYTGYYRLAYGPDATKFGHRIWLDVLVSETAFPEISSLGRVMGREVKNAFGKALGAVSKVLKLEKGSAQENPEGKQKEQPVVPADVNTSVSSQPKFQYESELQSVSAMGFDTEKAKAALLREKGNVDAAVNALIASS